jgi:hypothetical protein
MPLIAEPRKIQIVKLILDNVPIIAPFEFAKGTNMAKIKRPKSGPPITPNRERAASNENLLLC